MTPKQRSAAKRAVKRAAYRKPQLLPLTNDELADTLNEAGIGIVYQLHQLYKEATDAKPATTPRPTAMLEVSVIAWPLQRISEICDTVCRIRKITDKQKKYLLILVSKLVDNNSNEQQDATQFGYALHA